MAVMAEPVAAQVKRSSLWTRAFESRHFLGAMFMVPAIAILILFLAYPLALGFWLGMTDTKIGGAGRYIGFQNFVSLSKTRCSGFRYSTPSSTRSPPAR